MPTIDRRVERRTLLADSGQRRAALVLSVLLLAAPDAQAQAPDAQARVAGVAGRLFIHVNGASQSGSNRFSERLPFTIYEEHASFDSVHDIIGGGTVDAGGSIGIWRNLAVGASYSEVTTNDSTQVSGSVPHPLFFDSFRQVSSESLALRNRERATHLHAAWIVPLANRIELALSGGLSYFQLTQGVVVGVDLSETGPPFTRVNLDAVHTQEQTATAVGGNVGADVAYLITDQLGLGAFVRYATASADVPTPSGEVSVSLGGVQAGAGIRVRLRLLR